MDKIVYYTIMDMLSNDERMNVSIRITVKDFPIVENLEFNVDGNWVEDISAYDGNMGDDFESLWDNFKIRFLKFLDDNNMRIIMDIMIQDDIFVSSKYDLKVIVNSYE